MEANMGVAMFAVAPKKYHSVTDNQIEAIPSYYRVLLSFFFEIQPSEKNIGAKP